MYLPSGSKFGLGFECLHPWTSGLDWPRNRPREASASYGTAMHAAAEQWPECDLDALATKYDLDRHSVDRLHVDYSNIGHRLEVLNSVGAVCWREIGVAYDPVTDTVRVVDGPSDSKSTEFNAWLDLVVVYEGSVMVVDFKSGRAKADNEIPWQLKFGALAIARLIGASAVKVALWHVNDGVTVKTWPTLQKEDLDGFASEIWFLFSAAKQGPTPPVPGTHCVDLYCPMIGNCSATRGALAEANNGESMRLDTREDAARLYPILKQASAVIKEYDAKIRKMVRQRPVDMPSEKQLVNSESETTSIELTADTLWLLGDLIPREKLKDAIEYKTTKSALERAVGKEKMPEVMAKLESVGAVKHSTFTRVIERKNSK